MRIYRNLRVRETIATLIVSVLIFVVLVANLPRPTMAMATAPHIAEAESTEQNAEGASVASAIVIDHNAVDASVIPQTWLDEVRTLDTFFTHKSIGSNILDGIADLETQDPARYTINVAYGTGAGTGITHYQAGSNGDPQSKIDGFEGLIRGGPARDVAFSKFCVGDFPPWTTDSPDDVWEAYRDMMAGLQQDYPDIVFVWWTAPLTTQSDNRGNAEKAAYNALVRDYVEANGGILFDIADVQSHDLSGNPIVGPTGHEAMCNDYSSDGAHLNAMGRQRVARAMWWLLARVAGWAGVADWISVTAVDDVASIYPGETATYTLSLAAGAGSTAPVALTLQGAPAGAIVSFVPNPVIPPGTSLTQVATTDSTVAGIYEMTAIGSCGALTDPADLTLIVASATPSFTLSVSPTIQVAEPNQAVSYTASVAGVNGFSQPVDLTVIGLLSGVDAAWSVNPVIPDSFSVLTLSVSSSPPFGEHLLEVVGIAGAQVVTKEIELLVLYPFRVNLPIVLRQAPCLTRKGVFR